MNNPFALVVALALSAVVIAVAVVILSRLFPAPSEWEGRAESDADGEE